MRVVVFGDERRIGALEADRVVDLSESFAAHLADSGHQTQPEGAERVPPSLREFIERGSGGLADAERALARGRSAEPGERGPAGRPLVHPLAEVVLAAPWPGRRIACAGGNYGDHLAAMVANLEGESEPETVGETARAARDAGQWGFWKVTHEVAGPGGGVPLPRRTRRFDYEGEVAIVLGSVCKDVDAADVASKVCGFTLLNDWSIRDGLGPPRLMSYNLAKNFDGCVSMGPCLVMGEGDFANVDVRLRVNGELRQSFNTSAMIFSFGEIVAELSRDFTLLPGDVISGGTAAGTAADSSKRLSDGTLAPERFLKVGDTVELSSPQVGTLVNRIVEG